MPEPDWKQQLDTRLTSLVGIFPEAHGLRALAQVLVEAEIDAAYERGLIAGRSQTGYTTRRKKRESG